MKKKENQGSLIKSTIHEVTMIIIENNPAGENLTLRFCQSTHIHHPTNPKNNPNATAKVTHVCPNKLFNVQESPLTSAAPYEIQIINPDR